MVVRGFREGQHIEGQNSLSPQAADGCRRDRGGLGLWLVSANKNSIYFREHQNGTLAVQSLPFTPFNGS